MRIGLDCRLSGPTHAGIGRYIENVLIRLPTVAPDIEWVYIFHDKAQYRNIISRVPIAFQKKLANVEIHYAPVRHYTIAEQVQLPRLLHSLELDLLHIPHFNIPLLYRGKIVVTIHDLLWHEYQGTAVTTLAPWLYWIKYAAYRLVATQAIARARLIFVPAETIKQTLAHYYPAASDKVMVTKEGIDTRLLRKKMSGVQRKERTLLYVGSLYPHKNVNLVIDTLQQLPEWKLIIVGARSVFQKNVLKYVQEKGVAHQVTFAGYLSDEQLVEHIQTATALVQPSLSEGFGLTGVEALGLGTPVLASDIPIFHEIYQDQASYFDPHSVESFIASLKKLQPLDKKAAQKLIDQYSWDTMVEETVVGYKRVLN